MGGCCCCSSSKETVLSAPPAYYYYPRALEEHVLLSSHQGAASAFTGRLLVDTNLDTSSPDTYRPPLAPIPFNVTLQTPPTAQEICSDKNNTSLHSTNSNTIQELVAGDNHGTPAKLEELKESECKVQIDLELDSAKGSEIELAKSGKPIDVVKEEDTCPICLEAKYDVENPKLATKCDHHFHFACILEWMERSETCLVCDQVGRIGPSLTLFVDVADDLQN
ncbi:E3 ubiquitin-protein ligase [Spatholobus suberectus]|nr:E3 ubiquitin-protein ligase [Spatholobus suberectus]